MTTKSWSSLIDHTSDAGFRAWGSEISTKLAEIGLVQTSDTGQINWATVARAAASQVAGYEIWRFNDIQSSAAPIFLKLEYGTAGNAAQPQLFLTVGTGSNGAGTLTGIFFTRAIVSRGFTLSATTSYPSFASGGEGWAGVLHKVGSTSADTGLFGFLISRTCDSAGIPTATGAVVYASPSNNTASQAGPVAAARFAAPAASYGVTTTSRACLVPHGITNSAFGTDIQAFLHWMPTPRVAPVFAICTLINGEIAQGSTFKANLVGSTERTYLSLGRAVSSGALDSASYGLAMLWE